MPGYFFVQMIITVSEACTRPTIIVHGGFDSTLEELYASAMLRRWTEVIIA